MTSSIVSIVKVGGELLDEHHVGELAAIAHDVRALLELGRRIVFVHGGGPQTTQLQKALGQEPHIVAGRRMTDRAALEAIKMVVGGRLNIDLTAALRSAGVNALGLNGVSGGVIECVKRPPTRVAGGGDALVDYGLVGDIVRVDGTLLSLLLAHGYMPVLACIGGGPDGQAFNINADMVASGLAVGLAADRLVMITGTPGVLRDVRDPGSRIPRLTLAEAHAAIRDGLVKGGMIAKLEESIGAVERGVAEVQILGQLSSGDLVRAFAEPGTVGTIIVRDGARAP